MTNFQLLIFQRGDFTYSYSASGYQLTTGVPAPLNHAVIITVIPTTSSGSSGCRVNVTGHRWSGKNGVAMQISI